MFRRFSSLALVLLALATAGATMARAQGVASDPGVNRRLLIQLKKAQQRAMLKEPMAGRKERLERLREAKRHAKANGKSRQAGARMKGLDPQRIEKLRDALAKERQRRASAAAMKGTQTALAPNHLVNNPFPDQFNAGQSEVSIALDGLHVVAAWNDGQGYIFGGSTQGYGWSNDGGQTWHDGGSLPLGGTLTNWSSDPVVTVNEKTHKFYYAGLADFGSTNNGVGVVEGSFTGGGADSLKWSAPMAAVTRPNGTVLCDKEWICADSTNNTLHIVYSRFVISGGSIITDHIDYVRGTFAATWTWAAPVQLSSAADAGFVQGARVGVGPSNDVYAVWIAIGQSSTSYYGRDYLRMRKSANAGVTFAAQTTPDSLFSNFGAGAPGFNRSTGITFPGMTVDRTTTATRGRVYLTWNESVNFYFDALGTLVHRAESEGNNTPASADVFTIGDSLTGQILASDVDYWKFNGTQGQTVVIYTNQMQAGLDMETEILCSDGSTVMSFSENGPGGFTLHVFTLPTTGTYYLLADAWDGVSTGTYSIVTGYHVPLAGGAADRARDHRDIFVKYSADGSTWSGAPKLVSTTPAWFDDYLPEVGVAGNGKPYIAWFDFHDAPNGICVGCGCNAYLSRSDDGGNTWSAGSPVSDTTTVWSDVNSNIEPNMGDYIGIFTTATSVIVGWADGRYGNPDVFMATVPINYTGTTVSLVAAQATPTSVTVTWQATDVNGLTAHVERQAPGGAWTDKGSIFANGSDRYVYTDADVTPGETYGYRLSVSINGGPATPMGQTSVFVPMGIALALEGARPNPAPGTVNVYFTLPDTRPAQLELVDVTGRKVATLDVGGTPGSQNIDVTQGHRLRAGMYMIRLTHGGETLTKRVAVVE